MSKLTRIAALAVACALVLPAAGCARNKAKSDTAYVARDVNTLYALAKDWLDQRPLCRRRQGVRRGRAAASLFGVGPPRAADERVQLLHGQAIYRRDQLGEPLPDDPSGQQGRALRQLSRRDELLPADRGRHARPEDHPVGVGFVRRADPPLSRKPLCVRRAVEARPDQRPSRRQGNGDRPLLSAAGQLARGDHPLPHRGRQISDHQPHARSARAAGRKLSWRWAFPPKPGRPQRCSAPTIPAASGTSAATS